MSQHLTPEQAIEVLDQATSQLLLKRDEHKLVLQALQTVANVVLSSKEPNKPKEETK